MNKFLVKTLSLIMVGGCLSVAPVTSAAAKSVQTPEIQSFMSMPPLSNVRIASYSDANSTYTGNGGTIHKSALPFSFIATKSGFGGVRAVYVDNVDVTSIATFEDNGRWDNTTEKTTIDSNYIKKLSTGTHTAKIVFWDLQRNYTLSASFNFNLAD